MAKSNGDFLDRIVTEKKTEAAAVRKQWSIEELRGIARDSVASDPRRDFPGALRAEGLSLIAEMKRRSPSAGLLRQRYAPAELAHEYEEAGARALSVLTDGQRFGGSVEHLAEARAACGLPILRKDFLIDEIQVLNSVRAGADAVLLIARLLEEGELARLRNTAGEFGMAALVEVHDTADLARALSAGAKIIGINNRNLDTLEVNIETAFRLRAKVPRGVTVVAESGIAEPEVVERLEREGFDAVLIGEALLSGESAGEAVAELFGFTTS